MVQVNLRLEDGLLERVDRVRGLVPRNRWLVSVIERELGLVSVPVAATWTPVERAFGEDAEEFVEAPVPVVPGVVRGSQVAHRPTCECGVCKPPKLGTRE